MKILKIKTRNREIGDIGEKLAKKYLKKQGYKILETNYVAYNSEIDIIAKNRTTLAFVEVKTRTQNGTGTALIRPSAAVTPEKQRKIIKCAKQYASSGFEDLNISLDVIEVLLDASQKPIEINHIVSAFNYNSAKGH